MYLLTSISIGQHTKSMEPRYIQVPAADAIADLCIPTGNDRQDTINLALIDLVQWGYLYPVRTSAGIAYFPTEAGEQYVADNYRNAVDAVLEDIFDDY